MDSVIFVTVRSLSTGKKFLIPPSREATLDDRALVGTPVSLSRSVSRVEMAEKRLKRSEDPDGCCVADAELLTVVSCVIFVVARTLVNERQQLQLVHGFNGHGRGRSGETAKLTVGCMPNMSHHSLRLPVLPQTVSTPSGTRPALRLDTR
jgi:hypothetical protein